MTEYLIQKKTGRIYVKSEAYLARGDMVPYTPPEPLAPLAPLEAPVVSQEPVKDPVPLNPDFVSMTKDELETYAMKRFGVNLNKRKSQANLVNEVVALESEIKE